MISLEEAIKIANSFAHWRGFPDPRDQPADAEAFTKAWQRCANLDHAKAVADEIRRSLKWCPAPKEIDEAADRVRPERQEIECEACDGTGVVYVGPNMVARCRHDEESRRAARRALAELPRSDEAIAVRGVWG